jgi:hypothetical protein
MKPETESSVSKAKISRKSSGVLSGPAVKKKTAKRAATRKSKPVEVTPAKIENNIPSESAKTTAAKTAIQSNSVTDLEFLDTVKESVYKKLVDGELDLKIESGFKAIELKNKISETSENERLLLEILSEIRSDELSKTKS